MPRARTLLLAALLVSAALAASCSPAEDMIARTNRLPQDIRPAVRDAIWGHGNPYTWSRQENVVIETLWSDYRHGYRPLSGRKTYTIDLRSRRMRIDDEGAQSVSLYDGQAWRVFVRGQEMKKPSHVTPETVGYFAMLEYAAGEMRSIRTFFCLPFGLVEDGVRLKSLGQVRSIAEGSTWNVVKATFDPNVTGRLRGDRMLVYFDPMTKRVDRLMFTFADAPFHGIPHWGEWSEYRRLANGLILPQRLDFRMTDEKGAADLGRRLSILVDRMAFNVELPVGVYSLAGARPGPISGEAEPAAPKTLGRDVIDTGK